jgi:Protein of unknown function (DUF2735)
MITNFSGSAKIYTFPPRGRFAENSQHGDARDLQRPLAEKLALGGAWYHDEAIRDADKMERERGH